MSAAGHKEGCNRGARVPKNRRTGGEKKQKDNKRVGGQPEAPAHHGRCRPPSTISTPTIESGRGQKSPKKNTIFFPQGSVSSSAADSGGSAERERALVGWV